MAEHEHEGTIKPHHPFEPKADAEALKKAMKGLGTNEKAIIEILTTRTDEQRCEISEKFKSLFGKDLIHSLKKELTGDFEDAIVALMTPRPIFLARSLHSAIRGAGTKERVLVEILCSSKNSDIHKINEAYKEEYNQSLEHDIKRDTSSYFEHLLVALDAGHRSESHEVHHDKAKADAEALYKSGEKMTGTNESTFTKILVSESYPQLRCVFDEYEKIAHHSIEEALKKEMSGALLEGMLSIVKCVRSTAEYFAECLQYSMNRAGTYDHTLIRIIVSRSEIDLKTIKKFYAEKFGKSLSKAISNETAGDYKKVLLAIVKD